MNEILDILTRRYSDGVEVSRVRGEVEVIVARHRLIDLCSFLRDEQGFVMLVDLCAVDYPDRPERFEVVYHLHDIERARRARLKVRITEADAVVPSVANVWRTANWFEREAYDLVGIRFKDHPHLKRLLTCDAFEGHPLRKDYPKDRRQAR